MSRAILAPVLCATSLAALAIACTSLSPALAQSQTAPTTSASPATTAAANFSTFNNRGNDRGRRGRGNPGGSQTPSQNPTAVDPGPRGGDPGAGGPLPGLSPEEQAFFGASKTFFPEVEDIASGLGPRLNLDSCAGCHAHPAMGGSSPPVNPQVAFATANGQTNVLPSFITADGPVREVRFVRNPDGSPDGGVHALFVISGRPDAAGCNLKQPDFAGEAARKNVIFRIPTPTFGLGLVEAVTDGTLTANLASNAQLKASLGISGRLNRNGNDGTITRFGWKAQNASLLLFSAEAYNVEMGISNEIFTQEREQDPGCQFGTIPNSPTPLVTQPDDQSASPAANFQPDMAMFTAFMRLLAPPTPAGNAAATTQTASAQTAASTTMTASPSVLASAAGTAAKAPPPTGGATTGTDAARGRQVFDNIGCQACHTASLKTGNSSITGQSGVTINPFSDFAVHDMGDGLADGVSQGLANGREFRSAPLWGVGQRIFFLHDGRTNDIVEAIQQHASQGSEANGVIKNFNLLAPSDQQALVNFLRSL